MPVYTHQFEIHVQFEDIDFMRRRSVEHGSVSYEKYVEGCNLSASKYQGYSDVHRDRIEQPGYKML